MVQVWVMLCCDVIFFLIHWPKKGHSAAALGQQSVPVLGSADVPNHLGL